MGRVVSKLFATICRAGQIVSGMVVLAVMALYVHQRRGDVISTFDAKYFYSLTLAVVSVVVALMLLIPLNHTFRYFPIDIILSVGWFVAFAFLLLKFQHMTDCDQSINGTASLALGGGCNTQRAAWGFAFLSGCFWAATFLIGAWVTLRERRLKRRTTTTIIRGGA